MALTASYIKACHEINPGIAVIGFSAFPFQNVNSFRIPASSRAPGTYIRSGCHWTP